MRIRSLLMGLVLSGGVSAAVWPATAYAQYQDEIVVTASRLSQQPPGQYLVVPGNNLLLEIYIASDDRDPAARYQEIEATIVAMMDAAMREADISLSFVDDSELVRPLSRALFESAISSGRRPDTNVATIQLKTPIPNSVGDAFALATRLQRFASSIEEAGRITIDASDEVTVSVVNPQQYRPAVLALVTSEITAVTKALGPDYRAVLSGIDGQLKSFRAGDLALGFYLPYEYRIIPKNVTTIRSEDD